MISDHVLMVFHLVLVIYNKGHEQINEKNRFDSAYKEVIIFCRMPERS